jgi:hypothetical protein
MDWSGANGIIAVDLKGKKGGSLNRIPFTSHRDGWCKFNLGSCAREGKK